MSETMDDLIRLWEARSDDDAIGANWYLDLGVRALAFGHPSFAYDILAYGLRFHPDDAELNYRAALALARAGSFRAAMERVDRLLGLIGAGHERYEDTLSLAGRLAKDRYQRLTEPGARRVAAQESAARYASAYGISDDYFPGINAATMNVLGGDAIKGRELADSVLASCVALEPQAAGDYWLAATLGEACLLLDRSADAARWYAEATRLAGERVGDIASMRRQVRLLSEVIDVHRDVLQALDIPKVVAFSGHMIDAPGSTRRRFPPELESRVRARIREALERHGADFGYASAACGADIIFLEEMLARGGEIHVTLPFKRDEFILTSVEFAGAGWTRRFEDVLARATAVTYATSEGYLGDDVLFQYTGDLVNGMALLRAEQMATEPIMLAVLEAGGDTKPGGTEDTISRWRASGKPAEIIDLANVRTNTDSATRATERAAHADAAAPAAHPRREIRAMLFADVVGFSKLREEAAPSFFVEFLGQVADVIKHSTPRPASCNTWGDGLFIVFDSVTGAADFSLRLRDMVVRNDWGRVGLPPDTNIRIALHAGPVYRAHDPIIEKDNYFGSHVNRAARIEPVTAPGSVFVSEQTACLLAARGIEAFACDYLGVMDFAKKFGSGALYRLRRSNEIE